MIMEMLADPGWDVLQVHVQTVQRIKSGRKMSMIDMASSLEPVDPL
jgi:hypothetical protein